MKHVTLLFAVVLAMSVTTFGQVPQRISYQGLLTTGAGSPVADGSYDLKFEIFNLPGGGTLRHTETHAGVPVLRGTFSLALGPLPAIFSESLYVEVTALAGPGISSPLTFSPRSELTSAPYSLQSVSLLGPNSIATGVASNAGGSYNRARGAYSTVSGGGSATDADSNSASGEYSTIGGGSSNHVTGGASVIGGGQLNIASGGTATIGGGADNVASANYSTIGGGRNNHASEELAVIGGGESNSASNFYATVGGGQNNVASAYGTAIGGGWNNHASEGFTVIGGGEFNFTSGLFATVPGGSHDSTKGDGSFAAGRYAKARHDGAFVWSDGNDFGSTGANQFLIHADGGVGIGTNSPSQQLDVNGNISVRGTHVVYNSESGVIEWGNNGVGSLFFRTLSTQGDISSFSEMMVIRNTGNVGIGTTAPDQRLSVNGNASKSGGGTWAVFSDRRLKTDINPFRDGLSVIRGVNPVTFRYNGKRGLPTDETYVGVIAQEIKDVAPYTVDSFKGKLNPEDNEETDILRFDANALTFVTINALKELDARVSELEKMKEENKMLAARLSEMERIVKSLSAVKQNAGSASIGESK